MNKFKTVLLNKPQANSNKKKMVENSKIQSNKAL